MAGRRDRPPSVAKKAFCRVRRSVVRNRRTTAVTTAIDSTTVIAKMTKPISNICGDRGCRTREKRIATQMKIAMAGVNKQALRVGPKPPPGVCARKTPKTTMQTTIRATARGGNLHSRFPPPLHAVSRDGSICLASDAFLRSSLTNSSGNQSAQPLVNQDSQPTRCPMCICG
jgi:hypothetical protein